MRAFAFVLCACVFACDDEFIPPHSPNGVGSAQAKLGTPAERREAACKAPALPGPLPAAADAIVDAPKGTIGKLVVQGARDADKARAATGMQVGDAFDVAKTNLAMRHLYDLGEAEDVRLEVHGVSSLDVTFVLRPRAHLGEVVVKGGSIVDTAELERALHAKAGESFDPALVTAARATLVDSLHQRGYADASLRVTGLRPTEDMIDLCVELQEGPKVTIDRVVFSGISRVKEDELRALIDTDSGRVNAPSGLLDAAKMDLAALKMTELYFDRGMVTAVVTPKTPRSADKVSLVFAVEEGPVFTVRRYEVTGDFITDGSAYRKLLTQRAKDPFSRSKLNADLLKINDLHEKRGRKDMLIEPNTQVDEKNNTVDVVLRVVDPKKLPAAPPKPASK